MRKQAIQLLMAFAAVCSFGSALKAQTYAVEVHVPFTFQAANQTMSAGDYLISNTDNMSVQKIRSIDHGGALNLRAGGLDLSSPGGARAVFNVYGTSAYLSQVWIGSGNGFKLSATKREKAAQEAALKPETVTILADLR
jgi:hypothetical protein